MLIRSQRWKLWVPPSGLALGVSVLSGCGSLLGYEDAYAVAPGGSGAGATSGTEAGAAGVGGLGGSAGSLPSGGRAGSGGDSAGGATGGSAGVDGGQGGSLAGQGGSLAGQGGQAGALAGSGGATGGTGAGGGAGETSGGGGGAGGGPSGGAGGAPSGAGGAGVGGSAAGAAGSSGAGNGGSGGQGGSCPILYVVPPAATVPATSDGCSEAAPLNNLQDAFLKAASRTGLQEIRLCGSDHALTAGLDLPAGVSFRGGFTCGSWAPPAATARSTILFSGPRPATLLRVPGGPAGSAPFVIENISLLGAHLPGEAVNDAPVIGIDLVAGAPTVRHVTVETPSTVVLDKSKLFAAAGALVRQPAQAVLEDVTVLQAHAELDSGSDRASAGVGLALAKDATALLTNGRFRSIDNRSKGLGTASLAISVSSGATLNLTGGTYRASLGYSIDVKSSIVTAGILVSSGGTLIMTGALVAATSGSAGPDDGTPSRANVVGVGGDLFATLVIDASRIVADGAQGTGSSIGLGSLGAKVTATSSLFFGGASGTAAATAGVLAVGSMKFEHCTFVGGRPIAGAAATGLQVSEPTSSDVTIRSSLFVADSELAGALTLGGGCSVGKGSFANNAIAVVGPGQSLGGGILPSGAVCPDGAFTCLSDLEGVFPVTGATKGNQAYFVPGATVCGSTAGSSDASACANPTDCLDDVFGDYTKTDLGLSGAQSGYGFMPRRCSLVRGGEASTVKTDLNGELRAAARPTVGAVQASFTYVAVCP